MDRFRVRGPELSVSPYIEPQKNIEAENKNYIRKDDRNYDTIRPTFIKTSIIPQAKGSAYIELGQTKLICAVHGPRQNKKYIFTSKAILTCEFKFSTFSCENRRGHVRDSLEKEFSLAMEQAIAPAIRLEKYPKSTIEIFVTVLENGGTTSCLAAAITASSAALASAGIEMIDLVTACSAVTINDTLLIDPTVEEEAIALNKSRSTSTYTPGSTLLVALMPSLNLVTNIIQSNSAPTDVSLIQQGLSSCSDSCCLLHTIILQVLTSSVKPKVAVPERTLSIE